MFGHNSDDQSNNQPVVTEPSAMPAVDTPAPDAAGPSLPPVGGLPPANDAPQDSHPSTPVADDELLAIKQEALQHLSPLVGHLEQSPEEKFRTTMMMIQAADDQTLIKTAYEAAKEIGDEKARAQALLDVVNEINYFTQQHNS